MSDEDHLREFRLPPPPPEDWRFHPDGPLLGVRKVVSPFNGALTDAVVDLDHNEVIACHGASCHPFPFICINREASS